MAMSLVYSGMVLLSFFCALFSGTVSELAQALFSGAEDGVRLTLQLAGVLCLWSGFGRLMEAAGLSSGLARLLRPLLRRLFPRAMRGEAAAPLCCNLTANLLGLGNAATPFGIAAVRAMQPRAGVADDEMCRLVVMNTASVQLIPATVAALRAAAGCAAPFDLLPAVWCSSLLSVSVGLLASWGLGRLWR